MTTADLGHGTGEAVCVVRCIEGSARTGEIFHRRTPGNKNLPDILSLTLTAIEWYGKQVDQLDSAHHAKVTLLGSGVETLAVWDFLGSNDTP